MADVETAIDYRDGHELKPMPLSTEGISWCAICGGHPDDPVHQPGFIENPDDEGDDG